MERLGPMPFAMNDEDYSGTDDTGVTMKLKFGEFELSLKIVLGSTLDLG